MAATCLSAPRLRSGKYSASSEGTDQSPSCVKHLSNRRTVTLHPEHIYCSQDELYAAKADEVATLVMTGHFMLSSYQNSVDMTCHDDCYRIA